MASAARRILPILQVTRGQLVSCRGLTCTATCQQMQKPEVRAKYFPVKKSTMLPPGTFNGKVAFITGGGTGMGKGMASMLSHLGANVVIVSRKLDVLQKTADEITAETKRKVLAIQCDVREPLSVKEAVSVCVEQFDLPHIIINNAAGNFISPTERLSNNAWKTLIDIVLNGTVNVTMDIGKRLINAKQGAAFLSISTVYAESGSAFVTPSAAAKAGIEAVSKSLASEWCRYGMRFNVLSPGPIHTKGAFSRLDPTGENRELMMRRIPIGRFGDITELANIACYLVSDYANWVTGSVVKFDGGEFNYMAGEFNELHNISQEQWDMIESIIRRTKGS